MHRQVAHTERPPKTLTVLSLHEAVSPTRSPPADYSVFFLFALMALSQKLHPHWRGWATELPLAHIRGRKHLVALLKLWRGGP